MDKNIYAAIAMALYEYEGNAAATKSEQLSNAIMQLLDEYEDNGKSDKDLKQLTAAVRTMLDEQTCPHDNEPGIITIKPKQTLWNAKFLSMTQKPVRTIKR